MAKMGRPTRYRAEMCEQVIELGKEGMSKYEICLELGISYRVIYNWMDKYPKFMQAMGDAMAASQGWWEGQGRKYLIKEYQGNQLDASQYSRSMAARFPNDWREKTEVKQDLNVKSNLTDSERTAKINGILDSARARGAGSAPDERQEEVDPTGGTTE